MLRATLYSFIALGLVAQTPAPKPDAKPDAAAVKPAPAAAAVKPGPAAAPVKPGPAAAPVKPGPAAAPAAEAPKPDQVLARIDGVEIRESDMNAMYDNLAPQQQASMKSQGREKMVQNYLEFRLLVAKSHRLGLDKSPEYQTKAKLSGFQLAASELLKKESEILQKKTAVSDDDIKAYFEANKDTFKSPGKFNARHILIKTKGGPNGDAGLTDEEAQKKMAEIKTAFEKGGKWEDLAKTYSEDPGSKEKGGLYEGISFGQFVPEFEAAVKKQEIGKVGDPVKSQFGYHLIQVESRGDSEAPAFDAVKDQVKQKATQAKQETVWKEFIESLKKEIPVTIGAGDAKAAKPAAKSAAKPATKPAAKKTEGASK